MVFDRRTLLASVGSVAVARGVAVGAPRAATGFKLGLVTYNIAAEMDLPSVIAACKAAEFEGVELRTTHAHGVEPSMPPAGRLEVRKRFADAGVTLWGLGSVCEFHAADIAVVNQNIETCRSFCKLAADLGARGVKVRPNGFTKGVEPARTLAQIGKALDTCGKAASDLGVEIWLEMHGTGTQNPENIQAIMEHCPHPSVGVCWNSNPPDVVNGSIRPSLERVKKRIRSCHINELVSGYPYRELFRGLREIGYAGFTLMEVPGVTESPKGKGYEAAIRFMKYYRALWQGLNTG